MPRPHLISRLRPLHFGAGVSREDLFYAVAAQDDSIPNAEILDDGTLLTGAVTDYLRALYATIFVPPRPTPTQAGVICLTQRRIEQNLRDTLAVLRASKDAFVQKFVEQQPFNLPDAKWRFDSASLVAVINRRARGVDPTLVTLILGVYGTDVPAAVATAWEGRFYLPVADGSIAASPMPYGPHRLTVPSYVSSSDDTYDVPPYWRWMDIIFPVGGEGYDLSTVFSIAAKTALPLSPISLVRVSAADGSIPRPFANVTANIAVERMFIASDTGIDDSTATPYRWLVDRAMLRFFGCSNIVLTDRQWALRFLEMRKDSNTAVSEYTDLAGYLASRDGVSDSHYDNFYHRLIGSSESLVQHRIVKTSVFNHVAMEAAKDAEGGDKETDTDADPTPNPKPDTEADIDPDDADIDPIDPDQTDEPNSDTSGDSDGGETDAQLDDDTIAQSDQPNTAESDGDSMEPFALTPKENDLPSYLYKLAVHQLCTQLDLLPTKLTPEDAAALKFWCNQWLYIAPMSATQNLIEKLGLAKSLRPFMHGA